MVEHLFGMEVMVVRFYLRAPKVYAKIAQLVEHRSEESGVVGSIPTLGTNFRMRTANKKIQLVIEK